MFEKEDDWKRREGKKENLKKEKEKGKGCQGQGFGWMWG